VTVVRLIWVQDLTAAASAMAAQYTRPRIARNATKNAIRAV